MPHVQITMLEGRTTEQRRKIAKRITEVMVEEANATADAVSISFVQVPKDCYARNGILMLDKPHK
jgi:4-oxalocrotonate tautomerase